jgi:hypothetical protein
MVLTINFVSDLGADPSGDSLSDHALEAINGFRAPVEVIVPDGSYSFSDQTITIDGPQTLTLRAQVGAAPVFVAPRDCAGIWLDFQTAGEVRGIDIDRTAPNCGPQIRLETERKASLRDMSVRGRDDTDAESGAFLRPQALSESAEITIEKVISVEGAYWTDAETAGRAFVQVGHESVGTVRVHDCDAREYGRYGIDAGAARGPVEVRGGRYINNNRAQIRAGGPQTLVEDAHLLVDIRGSALSGGFGTSFGYNFGDLDGTDTFSPRLTLGDLAADGGETTLESFEDQSIADYGGNTGDFSVQSSTVHDGSYALECSSGSFNTATTIADTGVTVEQGETLICAVNISGANYGGGMIFGAQSEAASPDCYVLQIGDGGGFALKKFSGGSTSTITSQGSVGLSTGVWYELEVNWQTDGTMDCTLYDSGGSTVASISGSDTAYTSGGIGFYGVYANSATYFDHYQTSGGSSGSSATSTPTATSASATTTTSAETTTTSGTDAAAATTSSATATATAETTSVTDTPTATAASASATTATSLTKATATATVTAASASPLSVSSQAEWLGYLGGETLGQASLGGGATPNQTTVATVTAASATPANTSESRLTLTATSPTASATSAAASTVADTGDAGTVTTSSATTAGSGVQRTATTSAQLAPTTTSVLSAGVVAQMSPSTGTLATISLESLTAPTEVELADEGFGVSFGYNFGSHVGLVAPYAETGGIRAESDFAESARILGVRDATIHIRTVEQGGAGAAVDVTSKAGVLQMEDTDLRVDLDDVPAIASSSPAADVKSQTDLRIRRVRCLGESKAGTAMQVAERPGTEVVDCCVETRGTRDAVSTPKDSRLIRLARNQRCFSTSPEVPR